MTKRLVGYARVSTHEQSVDAQTDALNAHGCSVIYADQGVSGASTSRPQLDECLATLEPGDVLIVVRLDRLGRSAAHLATTVEGLASRGIGFRSLNESVDTTTATGRLVLGIFASLAAFERDLLRERTSAALQAKRRRGEVLGRPHALRPSQVEAAAKMLAEDASPAYVARLFNVDRATIYRAMRRRKQKAL